MIKREIGETIAYLIVFIGAFLWFLAFYFDNMVLAAKILQYTLFCILGWLGILVISKILEPETCEEKKIG
jgi:predicted membrane channel-forming protein YqfA (hemolysin III family)